MPTNPRHERQLTPPDEPNEPNHYDEASRMPQDTTHIPIDPTPTTPAQRRLDADQWTQRSLTDDEPDSHSDDDSAAPAQPTQHSASGEEPGYPTNQATARGQDDTDDALSADTSRPPIMIIARRTDGLPPWTARFLAALSITGAVSPALDHSGARKTAVYAWMKRSPRFAALVEEARERATDAARAENWTRGVEGWSEPVFYAGEVVGRIQKKSDACLQSYLKAHAPEYRDRQELAHTVTAAPARTPEEEQAQLAPYTDAALMLLRSLADAEAVKRGAVPALPAPQESTVSPDTVILHEPPQHGPKRCPRCASLVTPSIYCPICHGRPME
jgi:hypothetical protein